MNIEIEFVKIDTSETLVQFVNDKMKNLSKKFPWVVKYLVFFEKENTTIGENKICKIQAVSPKIDPFSKSINDNYEGAFKEALSELEKQLEKRKEVVNKH